MSSLDKIVLHSQSTTRTNVTASLLLKSKKYQEENKMPPSPFHWLICDTTAVVCKKPTLYTEHQQSSDLVHAVSNARR